MRYARRIAWATWAVTLLGNAIALSLLLANRTTAVPVSPLGYNGFWSFAAVTFVAFAFASVGALLATRRPGNAIGWLFCGTGVLATAELLGSQYAVYGLLTEPGSLPRPELGAWLYEWTGFVAGCVTATFVLMLFPDGRLPSRAWRPVPWLSGVGIALMASLLAFRPGPLLLSVFVENPLAIAAAQDAILTLGLLGLGLLLGAIVLSVASLATRYRRARVAERQQIKWIAYVAGLHAAAFAIFTLMRDLAPALVALAAAAIPIATGIAILRHRLYDIDLLIKRTVVYGATSLAIALTFFAGILALQALLRPLTSGSELAVAASTLLSFALFQPIRRRIQEGVDRRFDRSHYSAARTLDAFADQLRDEVDIDALRRDLLGAVERTMAPTHASVWLRSGAAGPVTISGRPIHTKELE
jgi:hypothetical protein